MVKITFDCMTEGVGDAEVGLFGGDDVTREHVDGTIKCRDLTLHNWGPMLFTLSNGVYNL